MHLEAVEVQPYPIFYGPGQPLDKGWTTLLVVET